MEHRYETNSGEEDDSIASEAGTKTEASTPDIIWDNAHIQNSDHQLTGAPLIQEFVKNLPNKPGVYRMFDEEGNVLYVGKARNLKDRKSVV